MVYTAIPDQRIPYDNDGTVGGFWGYVEGVYRWFSGAEMLSMNSPAPTQGSGFYGVNSNREYGPSGPILFFPEQREITAFFINEGGPGGTTSYRVNGSNNSGNGLDGTWETASLPAGSPQYVNNYSWRQDIRAISFTGGKRTIRIEDLTAYGRPMISWMHLYGEKQAGQTPDDIIYINHDDTPGVEYTAPEDFGDQPLGTTVVRQFRLKNTSVSKTANTINIQCNDSDFAISENGSTWVVTINLASLAAGAESPTYYVRCTTPSPGGMLGPRFARIVTTVASYT